MDTITIYDLPIMGAFTVYNAETQATIFEYDGKSWGDIPPDIALMPVGTIYAENNRLMISVPPQD